MNLMDLINERKAGRSYEQLSKACGGNPTAGRLQQIATKDLKTFPDPDTIRGLAQGLKVSERAVLNATGESLGIEVESGGSRIEQWLSSSTLSKLTQEQVDVVLRLVDAFVAPETRSYFVDGATMLRVPHVGSSTEVDGYVYPLIFDAFDRAFPEGDAPTQRAMRDLSRILTPELADLLAAERKRSVGPRPGVATTFPAGISTVIGALLVPVIAGALEREAAEGQSPISAEDAREIAQRVVAALDEGQLAKAIAEAVLVGEHLSGPETNTPSNVTPFPTRQEEPAPPPMELAAARRSEKRKNLLEEVGEEDQSVPEADSHDGQDDESDEPS